MTRHELRTICRHGLTDSENRRVSDAEFNSLFNQGLTVLFRLVGGVRTTATVTTNSDGEADLSVLPGFLKLRRVTYDGTALEKVALSQI